MNRSDVNIRVTLTDEAGSRLKHIGQAAVQQSRRISAAETRAAQQSRKQAVHTAQHKYRLLNQEQAAAEHAAQTRIRSEEAASRAQLAAASRASQARARTQMQSARTANAYTVLNIRSERDIQAEIRRTQAAYDHLAKSGTASQRELKRAAQNLREEHRRLNRELQGGSGGPSRLQRVGEIAAGIGGAAVAAYSVVNPKLDRIDALDQAKRRNAVLMDEGNSLESRRAALRDVDAQVRETVKYGVSQDFAIEVQNTLLSRGGLDKKQVGEAMKVAAYANIASGGEAEGRDLAVMQSGLLGFGYTADTLKDAVGKIYTGGKVGSYEVKDFARNAGEQLSVAKTVGMKGDKDLAFLIALNQNAAAISGSSDEAANNVKQFLASANNPQVKAALKKAGIKDVEARYLHGSKNGQNVVEVFDGMMQEILAKDAKWQNLQASMKTARTDEEKAEIARRQEKYLEGSAVGKILTDEQRRMGYLAYTNDRENFKTNFATLQKADRTAMDADYAFQEEGSAVKTARGRNQQDINNETTYKEAANQRGSLFEWWADFSGENPHTAAAASGGVDLAKIVAAYGLGSMLFGRLGGTAASGGGLTAGAGRLTAAALPLAARALPALGGAVGLWDANSRVNRNEGKGFFEGGTDSRAAGYAESALSGAALGAAVGSIIPGIGTAIGAALGGAGGLIAATVADFWTEDKPKPAGPPDAGAPVQPAAPPVQPILDSPILQQSAQQYSEASVLQMQAGTLFAEQSALGRQAGETMLQTAVQIHSSAEQIQTAVGTMAQGVNVRVTVENGNLAAFVDGAVSRAVRRNGG